MSKRYPSVSIDYSAKVVPVCVITGEDSHRDSLRKPSHVAVSPVTGNVVISDRGNHRILVYTDTGQFVSEFGSHGQSDGQLNYAGGVCVTSDGVIVVADTDNHRLQTFTEQGQFIRVIGQKGTEPGQFQLPRGLSCDQSGNIFVFDMINKRIQVLVQDGTVVRTIGTQDVMRKVDPIGIDICPKGDIIVPDMMGKIEVFTAGGEHKTTLIHENVEKPADVAVDKDGNIIVTDWETHQVHVLRQSGELVCTWGGYGDKLGELNGPLGVCCTADGQVVVADCYNNRVQSF